MNILNSVPQYYVLIHIRRKIVYHNLLKFCFLHRLLFLTQTNLTKFFLTYCLQLINEIVIFHGVWHPPSHSKNVFPPYQSLPTWCHPSSSPYFSKKIFPYMTCPHGTIWNIPHIHYISFQLMDMFSMSQSCLSHFLILCSTRLHFVTFWLQLLQNHKESFELNITHINIIVHLFLKTVILYNKTESYTWSEVTF